MIVVQLQGGLGNQMFQYAAGRRLALHRRTKLYLDIGWFDSIAPGDTVRFYELDSFKIAAKLIRPGGFVVIGEENETLKTKIFNTTKGRLKPRLKLYREKSHAFDTEVLNLPDKSYLQGWWQSEKYFADIREMLIKDFRIKTKPDVNNQDLLDQINGSLSVSLHVRRQDYVTNKMANAQQGLVPLSYYKKATEHIAKKVRNPKFFIISDDPDWCQNNLKTGYPTVYVKGNPAGFEDMRLMMSCKHHIIANSSFSWWGAWLNPRPDKIVVAPKRWARDTSLDKSDLVPEDWTKL